MVLVAPARAESNSERVMMQKIREMEAREAKRDAEINAMRSQLRNKSEREAIDEQVADTLNKSSTGFYHDPGLHKRAIKIGGELDVTYAYNFNRPDDRVNALRGFDGEDANDFNVHAANLIFDGTAEEKGQAGFRIDLGIGTDARKAASYDRASSRANAFFAADEDGVIDSSVITTVEENGNDRLFDLQEAYIDYIAPVANGIHFSFGKFVTPFGLEVIESAANWNASRSFNFNYAIPFTHTGARATYAVTENWTISGYVVNGWDNLQDNNQGKTGILASTWAPLDWLSWTVTAGAGVEGLDDDSDTRYLVNTVISLTPWDTLSFALEGSYGYEENGSATFRNLAGNFQLPGVDEDFIASGPDDAEWYGAAGYVKWQFLENWYVAARGEYFNDRNGARTGLPQTLYSGTATVDWKLSDPMHIRFEYRHDGSSHNPFSDSESPAGYKTDANTNDELDTRYGTPGRNGRSTQDTFMIQWLYNF
jgi:hypothetical protein